MPRLRHTALAAAMLCTCGAAAGAALAADQEVVAQNSSFTPSLVAVAPGDTLTIRHDDGDVVHELQFDDRDDIGARPGTGWTVTRTFSAAEARDAPYGFFCSLHAGMEGSVYVNATGTVPTATATASPTRTATPTVSATASATPPVKGSGSPGDTSGGTSGGGTSGGGTSGGGSEAATLRSAGIAARACMRRGPSCRRPGARLRIDLSAAADVGGTLHRRAPGARRFRAFGAVRFGRVAAGPRTLVFTRTAAGKRLRPGRYKLVLKAAGATRTLAFRVV